MSKDSDGTWNKENYTSIVGKNSIDIENLKKEKSKNYI